VGAIELVAAALIVLAVVVCVLTVIVSAADAGRIAAERLRLRAEARIGGGQATGAKAERTRGAHRRGGVPERPPRRRG